MCQGWHSTILHSQNLLWNTLLQVAPGDKGNFYLVAICKMDGYTCFIMAHNATATIGGGCFWCVEAVYKHLEGVRRVVSGYAGGQTPNPTYKEVCSGSTGHAEVTQIEFDPDVLDYRGLLDIFWKAHDPTTPNRQGADSGTQYRSIILYHDEEQHTIAIESRDAAQKAIRRPIVTEIVPLQTFYPAEDYHQDYYDSNPTAAYCSFVIRPKLKKMGMT